MRIPRIYQPVPLQTGGHIQLGDNAAHHLTRVLRMQSGANLILFNGMGGEYAARLEIHGKSVGAQILQHHERNSESPLDITLLQGISKGERMDIVMQKAVELGVSRIVPVICARTVVNIKAERSEKKFLHWQGIIISACEQSGRTRIPELHNPVSLGQALQLPACNLKLTLSPAATTSLKQLVVADNSIALLIGPEGGLDDREIQQAGAAGYIPVRLGPRVLRTETAALTAISILQNLYGDLN